MKKINRWLHSAAITAVASAALLAGCTNADRSGDQESKSAIAAAFSKNMEISNYAFTGKLKLAWDATGNASPASSPLVSVLQAVLGAEKGMEWRGTLYADPLRMEADIAPLGESKEGSASNSGGSSDNHVPLLVQDNKMYISIPTLNKENEYYQIDRPLDLSSTAPFDPTAVKLWLDALDGFVPAVAANVDPIWIRRVSGTLEEGPMRIEIPVTEKNRGRIGAAFAAGWGAELRQLEQLKLISGDIAKRWAFPSDGMNPTPGGMIAVTINEDGFLSEQWIDIAFPNGNRIELSLSKSQINREPGMTKPVPEKVLLLSDVLSYIESNRASGGNQ